jgi:NO-binding membrane sensor protein with MHYT domain
MLNLCCRNAIYATLRYKGTSGLDHNTNIIYNAMSVNFLAILLSLLASATPLQHENCLPESIDKPCQCKMERSMGVFDISQVFQGVKLP